MVKQDYKSLSDTAGWLFIAGALLQEVAVYYENGKSCFYPPCPCNVDDHGQVQFYIDSKQRIYPLSQRKLWRGIPYKDFENVC